MVIINLILPKILFKTTYERYSCVSRIYWVRFVCNFMKCWKNKIKSEQKIF